MSNKYRIIPSKGGLNFAYVFGSEYPTELDADGKPFETFSAADTAAIKAMRERSMTPYQAPVSDADLDAFISFVGGSDIGPLMITALAIAQDAKRTRALLSEAREALEAGETALMEVGSKLIYRDGKTYSRAEARQLSAILSKLIEACP